MNYEKIYNSIIHNAQKITRTRSKQFYYEEHHIIPKCLGGCDEKINLVFLTAKEHFVCHHLLTKIYKNESQIQYAFWMMINCKSENQQRITATSNQYNFSKIQISKHRSNNWKIDNPNNYRSAKGENNPMYGVHRYGNKNPFFGKQHSEESKKKQAESHKGFIFTEDHKEKLKEAWQNKPMIECPHCDMISNHKGNMLRYHMDKCKFFKKTM